MMIVHFTGVGDKINSAFHPSRVHMLSTSLSGWG